MKYKKKMKNVTPIVVDNEAITIKKERKKVVTQ
jgi:hypothetical protein